MKTKNFLITMLLAIPVVILLFVGLVASGYPTVVVLFATVVPYILLSPIVYLVSSNYSY